MNDFDHHTFPSVIKIINDDLDILIQIFLVEIFSSKLIWCLCCFGSEDIGNLPLFLYKKKKEKMIWTKAILMNTMKDTT